MRCALLLCVCALLSTRAWSAAYTVDAATPGHEVNPLNGVNAGPGHMKHLPGGNFAAQYQQMGVRLVRAHDYYGPCDLSQICPWIRNPLIKKRVPHFAETDATISEIEAAGCQVLFRLGESWYKDDPHNEIPSSFTDVANACVRIVDHYGGHEATPYRARIRLWEIWNEPDQGMFWDLTNDPHSEQFMDLYVQVAKALQQEYPWIIIGGPGAKGGEESDQVDFCERLAQACHDAGAPLDFYSWHYYNSDYDGPYIFARRAQKIRQTLNAAGFAKTYNVLDEWNSAHLVPESQNPTSTQRAWNATFDNAEGAAYSASVLIYLHLYTDVRYACRYRGDYWVPESGYGLIESDGKLKKPGYAFQAYAGLFPGPSTRKMYLLTGTGGDLTNRAVMGTIDQAKSVVNVLISQYKTAAQSFTLSIKGLPSDWREPTLEHYVVSETADDSQVLKRALLARERPNLEYTYTVKAMQKSNNSVHMVRVYDAVRFPYSRPTSVAPAPSPGNQPQRQRRPYPRQPRQP